VIPRAPPVPDPEIVRTVEAVPSPIVVFAVTATAWLIVAVSPAPGGPVPPHVAALAQLPLLVDV
jgi:hypothetical protein